MSCGGSFADPAELCDPALSDRVAVEAHLLEAFIPACYRAAERWTAGQAMVWLTFLAHHPVSRL